MAASASAPFFCAIDANRWIWWDSTTLKILIVLNWWRRCRCRRWCRARFRRKTRTLRAIKCSSAVAGVESIIQLSAVGSLWQTCRIYDGSWWWKSIFNVCQESFHNPSTVVYVASTFLSARRLGMSPRDEVVSCQVQICSDEVLKFTDLPLGLVTFIDLPRMAVLGWEKKEKQSKTSEKLEQNFSTVNN